MFPGFPLVDPNRHIPSQMLGRTPSQEITYGGCLGETFLPGQKAKLLLVHHTVGCRMESAVLAFPVRNTLGSILGKPKSVLLSGSPAGWAHILTGRLRGHAALQLVLGAWCLYRQREQLRVIFIIII